MEVANPKTLECHMLDAPQESHILERRGVLNSLLNPESDRFHQAFCRVALADGKRYEGDSLFCQSDPVAHTCVVIPSCYNDTVFRVL